MILKIAKIKKIKDKKNIGAKKKVPVKVICESICVSTRRRSTSSSRHRRRRSSQKK